MFGVRSASRRAGSRERGSVAVTIALCLIAVIGFVALGSEVVFILLKHREMQAAADASALAGATALGTGSPADFRIEANAIAASAGFQDGVGGTTVTLNHPPTSGTYAGNTATVEAIVSQPQTLAMLSLFGPATWNVGARAVALSGSSGRYCLLALDPSASGAVTIDNNATIVNSRCGIADNSSSATALIMTNNARINGPVLVHGGWSLSNGAAITGTPRTQYGGTIADPYANVNMLTPPSCTGQPRSGSGTFNLVPGHFCTGWSFTNTVTLNLAAGIYYIDTQLSLSNNVTVNGQSGVTIVVNGNYAINLGNNVTLNLTAPSSGNYAGIAIYGNRTGTPTVIQSFANNSILNITGAVYFPNQIVRLTNNGATPTSVCAQLIGRILRISNNVNFDNQCSASGVVPIGATPSTLVE